MNDYTLVDGYAEPDEEGFVRKGAASAQFFVKFWVEGGEGFGDVFIEDKGKDGEESVEGCVAY